GAGHRPVAVVSAGQHGVSGGVLGRGTGSHRRRGWAGKPTRHRSAWEALPIEAFGEKKAYIFKLPGMGECGRKSSGPWEGPDVARSRTAASAAPRWSTRGSPRAEEEHW